MKGRILLPLAIALATLPVSYAQTDPAQMKPVAYQVVDGNKVDNNTLQGWRTWRALACERCHGAQQQGMVGPSLIDAFKTIDPAEFHRTVFGSSNMMQKNWQNLFAYLKGRSDGKIKPGDLQAIDAK
jgi:cytochrome c2